MSKYIDMLADKYRCHCGTCEVQKGNVSEEECKICSHYAIREALQMADRLEQNHMNVLDRFCRDDCNCEELEDCKRNSDLCVSAILWKDGYNQALADMRGDTE